MTGISFTSLNAKIDMFSLDNFNIGTVILSFECYSVERSCQIGQLDKAILKAKVSVLSNTKIAPTYMLDNLMHLSVVEQLNKQ